MPVTVLAKAIFQLRRQCCRLRLAESLLVSAALGVVLPAFANGSITLAWDPSPSDTVVGYRIYYGLVSGNYTVQLEVGNQTSATVTNLIPARTYYFAATAYNTLGVESEFSEEVSARVPLPPPEPHVPAAESQELTTEMDTPAHIVLGSQTGENGPREYLVTTPPVHGALSPETTGPERLYTPNPGYVGTDSFGFVVREGEGTSAEARVWITVRPLNQPPIASSQTVATFEDFSVDIQLRGRDPEGSPLTFAIPQSPAHGLLSGEPPDLTYTPAENYNGQDSFTFSVSDGTSESAPATVFITVIPVNDPPVARSITVNLTRESQTGGAGGESPPIRYQPLWTRMLGSDADQDPIGFEILRGPLHGELGGIPPNVTYLADASFQGLDVIWFRVTDGKTASPAGAITIRDPALPLPLPRLLNLQYRSEVLELEEGIETEAFVEFGFDGAPFKKYQVEVSSDLRTWVRAGEFFADFPVKISQWVSGAAAGFYRVVLAE